MKYKLIRKNVIKGICYLNIAMILSSCSFAVKQPEETTIITEVELQSGDTLYIKILEESERTIETYNSFVEKGFVLNFDDCDLSPNDVVELVSLNLIDVSNYKNVSFSEENLNTLVENHYISKDEIHEFYLTEKNCNFILENMTASIYKIKSSQLQTEKVLELYNQNRINIYEKIYLSTINIDTEEKYMTRDELREIITLEKIDEDIYTSISETMIDDKLDLNDFMNDYEVIYFFLNINQVDFIAQYKNIRSIEPKLISILNDGVDITLPDQFINESMFFEIVVNTNIEVLYDNYSYFKKKIKLFDYKIEKYRDFRDSGDFLSLIDDEAFNINFSSNKKESLIKEFCSENIKSGENEEAYLNLAFDELLRKSIMINSNNSEYIHYDRYVEYGFSLSTANKTEIFINNLESDKVGTIDFVMENFEAEEFERVMFEELLKEFDVSNNLNYQKIYESTINELISKNSGEELATFIKTSDMSDDEKASYLFNNYLSGIISLNSIINTSDVKGYPFFEDKLHLLMINNFKNQGISDLELSTLLNIKEDKYIELNKLHKDPSLRLYQINYTRDMLKNIIENSEDWSRKIYITDLPLFEENDLTDEMVKKIVHNDLTGRKLFERILELRPSFYYRESAISYYNFLDSRDISILPKDKVTEEDLLLSLFLDIDNFEYINDNYASLIVSKQLKLMMDSLNEKNKDESINELKTIIYDLKLRNSTLSAESSFVSFKNYSNEVVDNVFDKELLEYLDDDFIYNNFDDHDKILEIIVLKLSNYYNVEAPSVKINYDYSAKTMTTPYGIAHSVGMVTGTYNPSNNEITFNGVGDHFYHKSDLIILSVHEFYHYLQHLAYLGKVEYNIDSKDTIDEVTNMEIPYQNRLVEFDARVEELEIIERYFERYGINFLDLNRIDIRIDESNKLFKTLKKDYSFNSSKIN